MYGLLPAASCSLRDRRYVLRYGQQHDIILQCYRCLLLSLLAGSPSVCEPKHTMTRPRCRLVELPAPLCLLVTQWLPVSDKLNELTHLDRSTSCTLITPASFRFDRLDIAHDSSVDLLYGSIRVCTVLSHVTTLSATVNCQAVLNNLLSVLRPPDPFTASFFSQLRSLSLSLSASASTTSEQHQQQHSSCQPLDLDSRRIEPLFPSVVAFPQLRSINLRYSTGEFRLQSAAALSRLPSLHAVYVRAAVSEETALMLLSIPQLRLLDLSSSRPIVNEYDSAASVVGLSTACEVLRLPEDTAHLWVWQLLRRCASSVSAPQLHTVSVTASAHDPILAAVLYVPALRKLHVQLLGDNGRGALPAMSSTSHITEVYLAAATMDRGLVDVIALVAPQLRSVTVEKARVDDSLRPPLSSALSLCSELRVCELRYTVWTVPVATLQWSKLVRLSMPNAELTSETLYGVLQTCSALEDVELACGSEHVAHLLSKLSRCCDRLRRLCIEGCRVQAHVQLLQPRSTRPLTRLTQLSLSWGEDESVAAEQIPDDFFAQLTEILQHAPLSCLSLGMRYRPAMLPLLAVLPRLQQLAASEQRASSTAIGPQQQQQPRWDGDLFDAPTEADSSSARAKLPHQQGQSVRAKNPISYRWPLLHFLVLSFDRASTSLQQLTTLFAGAPQLSTVVVHTYGSKHVRSAVRIIPLVGRHCPLVHSLTIRSHSPPQPSPPRFVYQGNAIELSGMRWLLMREKRLPPLAFTALRKLDVHFDPSSQWPMARETWQLLRDSEWLKEAPLVQLFDPTADSLTRS